MREKYPLRHKARVCIKSAIAAGKIPPVKELLCNDCDSQAEHYHHSEGYQEEKWGVVEPLCRGCHLLRHSEEVG